MNQEILYIKRNNRSTDIIYNNKTINCSLIIEKYIDSLLEKSLATYRGRLLVTSRVYHLHKYVPIYVDKNLMLQPVNNKNSWNETLINICMIDYYENYNNKTLVYFKGGGSILIEFSTKKMYNILRNCETIINKQFNIERKNIYG